MTDPEKFKNVTLDVESYDDLKLWADREVRSVSGQVKWLIQKRKVFCYRNSKGLYFFV